jgi:hypothetical protein
MGGSDAMSESMEGKYEVVIRQGEGALVVDRHGKDNQPVFQTIELGTVSARLNEDSTVRNPQYLAYEIRKAETDTPVSVFLRSKHGFNLTRRDSIGYAYYAEGDFLVEQIRLEVEFRGGLTPEPNPPIARAQLIRRTSLRPDSTDTDRDLAAPTKVHDEQTARSSTNSVPCSDPKVDFFTVWFGAS